MAARPPVSDQLANERTYLAYIRTALAFVAFGFVIARFALFAREISVVAHISVPHVGESRLLGVAMVLVGVLVALGGGMRYGATHHAIEEGRSAALSPVVAYVGAALVLVIGAVVAANLFRF
jgi:putative membrane protein